MLPTHDRYDYAPITKRPFFRWPNSGGLAVYLALNVEHYAFGEGLAEDLVPDMAQPDVLNSSWREYGTRVGAWRLLELFEELEMPATILLNSAVCDHAPDLVRAMVDAGCEIAAHGRTNSESQTGLAEDDERALIEGVTETISRAAGTRPTGWLSPWLAETELTPDLVEEAGYDYLLDWCADDQPIWLRTRKGRIMSLPYAQEINDSAAIMGRFVGAAEFADMIIDQVDEMLAQATKQPLVLGVALHANIIGQPFRIRQLRRALKHIASLSDRVWLTRAAEIVTVAKAQPENVV